MSETITCTSKPDGYSFRIEFKFINPGGAPLASKTWALRYRRADTPRLYFLQAEASLTDRTPELKEIAPNYFILTTKLSALDGELRTALLRDLSPVALRQQLATSSLTFTVSPTPERIRFNLHVAGSKSCPPSNPP